ncbi:MAG: hypothetical protein Q8O97_02540 [bacterium]|nr:hypothetical protein [bacterium]
MVTIGNFEIRPDSDSGSRQNDLLIRRGEERLVLSSGPAQFGGSWGPEGWRIDSKVFDALDSEEAVALRYLGINLLPGRLGEAALENLEERVNKIGFIKLDKVLKEVFDLCRKEEKRLRRMERPWLLRWLPIK